VKKPPVAIREFKKPKDMRACPTVRFTHNAKGVMAFNSDGYVVLWDSESAELLKTLRLPQGYYFPDLWMSPDRRWAAVAGSKATYFIDTASLKKTAALPFEVDELRWSRNGDFFLAVKRDEETSRDTVHIFRTEDRREIASLELPKFSESPKFWGDADELIFSGNGAISTWNPREKKIIKRAKFVDNIWPIGWSEDGKTYFYKKGSKIAFLDANWKIHPLGAPEKTGGTFAISPDGKRLAMTIGNTIVIWDVAENQAWLKWKRPNYGEAMSVDFSPDGQQLVATPDHEVQVLDFRADAKSHVIALPKPKPGEIQCLNMVGPDERMDQEGWKPINPLKEICHQCKRVDLNWVSAPYALARKIESPVDFAPAVAGNFLVRDSMKRVLDIVLPGLCKFYPTVHRKTKQPTPWLLAVPQHIQTTAVAKGKPCSACGEPVDWEENEATDNPGSTKGIFKSRNLRWAEREHYLYFSVRLETLVKKLGLRGMVRSYDCKQEPTSEDLAWVQDKLSLVQKADAKSDTSDKSASAEKWFKEYLAKNTKENLPAQDFATVEKKHRIQLPDSYKRFITAVGPKVFKDIDGAEGFRARVLPPKKLEFAECCERGTDDEVFQGVMFAATDHGDAFYFDPSRKWEVRKHDHEVESYEPYAKNFAECIKRFAGA
jgi:hypothetical protein